ncbi:unnamed protein product [Candida verbasci]|uniref:Zn(2)-C6 fungal-type domain-containing protein n=1 Tax=Candida verbasci TaxID=1227364 RepID=A0A9W4TTV5_9ASCO|nr:unnamed protein product [Candida verbasci]
MFQPSFRSDKSETIIEQNSSNGPSIIKATTSAQKRGYSRNGCRECKRRKIKCDEGKPACGKCTKLNKTCSYPEIGEKVLRVSKKKLESIDYYHKQDDSDQNNHIKPLTIQMYSGPNFQNQKKKKQKKKLNPQFVYNNLDFRSKSGSPETVNLNPVVPSIPFNISSTTSAAVETNNCLYNDEDLNLIASDLNNIVNDIMFTSNMNMNFDSDQFVLFDPADLYLNNSDDNNIPRHVSIESIKLKTLDEKGYLSEFYNTFAPQILPFGALDPITQTYSNPIRDVLLKYGAKEPFLLSAILSQGAKIVYEKTKNQKDLDNYGSYLSNCLRLLGPALSKNRDKFNVKDDLISNIETILLTVLLLTSSNATTSKQSWRPHLKGAKDIIIKATNSKINASKTLILCKVWFADFEILAGLSSHLGGTLKTDDELNSIINFDDDYIKQVLTQYGMLQENNFNIMFGYDNDLIYLFRDLTKILNKKRESPKRFILNNSLEYIRLISGFYQHYQKVYSSKSCKVDDSNLFYNLVDTIYFQDNTSIRISWMDISQQAFALAGLITMFASILLDPPESPHIQDLNSKLIKLIEPFENAIDFNRLTFTNALSMIQWPIIIAGLNCTSEDDHQKSIIINFFKICFKLGSSSAEIAIKRIEKLWNLRKNGLEYVNDNNDEINENKIDTVAY